MSSVTILSNTMKASKTFLVFALCFAALFAQAQTSFTHTKSNPTGLITNTGSDTSTYSLPGYYETLSIQPTVVKASGTLAGTAIFQFSTNGKEFLTSLGDTVTLANVAESAPVILHLTKPDFLFMRIITTGSGTMTANTAHVFAAKKSSF